MIVRTAWSTRSRACGFPMIDGGLRKMFHANVEHCHWTAIESGLTSQGIPDSHFCLDGVSGWVEYKRAMHWKVGMRPEQCGWIERQLRNGGRVFIAVRQLQGGGDKLWLLHGRAARHLVTIGLKSLPEGTLFGIWDLGHFSLPWKTIRKLLKSNGKRF